MSLIYKIYCKDENIKEFYIGSTNNLTRRKYTHKQGSNNINNPRYNVKLYTFIRANGGLENFDFVILEQFETIINKTDLFKIEGQYIKNNNATLNCQVAGRTDKEYYQDNKTKVKEKCKIYRENNKETRAENSKTYYQNNKEKLNEKIECIYCKSLSRKKNLKRHQQSKKCLKIQNTNQI